MNEKLIKDLCTYLGELDYIIENSKDVLERGKYERKREAVHVILDLPYKVKRNERKTATPNVFAACDDTKPNRPPRKSTIFINPLRVTLCEGRKR